MRLVSRHVLITLLLSLGLVTACSDSGTDSGADQSDDDALTDPDLDDAEDDQDSSDAEDDEGEDEEDGEGGAEEDAADEEDALPPDPIAFECAANLHCMNTEVCIEGWCRLPVAQTSWVSLDFTITQPDRVTHVFDNLKALGTEVAFVGISVDDYRPVWEEDDFAHEDDPVMKLFAQYGSVDIMDRWEGMPTLAQWQFRRDFWDPPSFFPPGRGELELHPHEPESEFHTPHSWRSDPFTYELAALVSVGNERVGIGLTIEEAIYQLTRRTDETLHANIQINGIVTRAEAEASPIDEHSTIGPLRFLLCKEDPSHDPRQQVPSRTLWTLADILDCNGAEMDAASEEGGEIDAYLVEVIAPVYSAPIQE